MPFSRGYCYSASQVVRGRKTFFIYLSYDRVSPTTRIGIPLVLKPCRHKSCFLAPWLEEVRVWFELKPTPFFFSKCMFSVSLFEKYEDNLDVHGPTGTGQWEDKSWLEAKKTPKLSYSICGLYHQFLCARSNFTQVTKR